MADFLRKLWIKRKPKELTKEETEKLLLRLDEQDQKLYPDDILEKQPSPPTK